jgi:hypothetical protein
MKCCEDRRVEGRQKRLVSQLMARPGFLGRSCQASQLYSSVCVNELQKRITNPIQYWC